MRGNSKWGRGGVAFALFPQGGMVRTPCRHPVTSPGKGLCVCVMQNIGIGFAKRIDLELASTFRVHTGKVTRMDVFDVHAAMACVCLLFEVMAETSLFTGDDLSRSE